MSLLLAFTAALVVSDASAHELAGDTSTPKLAVVRLCDALKAIQQGDRLRVAIEGVLRGEILYDPEDLNCGGDVQPVTWVPRPKDFIKPKEMADLEKRDGRFAGLFIGILLGELRPNADLPHLHQNLAYGARVGGSRRYGFPMRYRTMLVLEEIEGIRPAAIDDNSPPSSWLPGRSPYPVVRRSSLPTSYPWMAANLHLSGDVVVEVDLKMGNVVTTKVISAADRLLIEDTLANIKTWEFDLDAEATFTTTFSYRFEDLPSTTPAIRVQTELPVRVEIIAPSNKW